MEIREVKDIEVIPVAGSPFKVTFEEAFRLTSSGYGKWKGRKKVYLFADERASATWALKQSGYAGPLVLQIVSK